jgi:mannose-1-phosphate guanylyltransferase
MPSLHHYALILAGGRGTRFWPRSRRRRAKQVLNFLGERSLIQQTVDRLKLVLPARHIWVITNRHLQKEIIRQLPDVPAEQILAEPAQRNTAPCIGLAAHILHSLDPKAVLGVFPADHYISQPRTFARYVRLGYAAARKDAIVVFGIEPRWPETGYGYIELPKGAATNAKPVPIVRFVEKPDRPTAERYLAAGNFYWNAGMFFWRTSVILGALRRHLPRTWSLLASLPDSREPHFWRRVAAVFPRCENISIDYAVLEKAQNVVAIPVSDVGWNDVGSWNAVYELLRRDAIGNASTGTHLALGSRGCYVDAPGKLVALLGVQDLVIVDTPDALLVAHRHQAQRVSEIVAELEKQGREDLL